MAWWVTGEDSCLLLFGISASVLNCGTFGSPGWTETWKQLMLLTPSLHILILDIEDSGLDLAAGVPSVDRIKDREFYAV